MNFERKEGTPCCCCGAGILKNMDQLLSDDYNAGLSFYVLDNARKQKPLCKNTDKYTFSFVKVGKKTLAIKNRIVP